ncbi:histidine phosphatase family protein [Microbacterium marinilacus]|uniref:Histidine phosphatase family protein n=1 Tax=Microbacterium marinilacus TaxID=415209 RepID=A0ABP7BAS3_9MICO|nr:histidine phosphatase family protein [Microbacterium marinilacus]MBY0686948.1 histidine phosphatase family protein [Microbacterium marinilacus]
MSAERIHLVRHGEVYNPGRVLYERLPGFRLSDDGRRMALAAAEHVRGLERPVGALLCSPLQRTQESAEPFAELFGLEPRLDERVIEPTNVFAGMRMSRALRKPWNWYHLRRPALPSWGEPYAQVVERMRAALDEVWHATPAEGEGAGDVVIVSHQAPIWLTHLSVAGLPLQHDPRTRRCALSSVTSFERVGDVWREVSYAEPAQTQGAVDVGAV